MPPSTDLSAERPASHKSSRFGRYELLSLIGRGGMAEVWRARLQLPAGGEKILVLKRILPSYAADPEQLRMFVNEAKITLPLTHGNITSVFEFGEVEGEYFLAMEYIHGQNLGAVLHRVRDTLAPMPIPAALCVAGEVAKGLAYAHGFTATGGGRIEVVHLDVSPQNVLISYDGAVKLTDFGIAKVKHQQHEAPVDVLRGKPAYIAPEQIAQLEGRPGAIDGRTDVFALGSVLYTMLTGVPPFQGQTDEETLALVRDGSVVPPSQVRSGLEPYDALVMKALAVKPDDRYARAGDFAAELNRALVERFPGYGTQELASWLRELFAWDIYESQAADGAALRDRLLFQLTHAQVELDPSLSTKELMKVGAVSIPPPPPFTPAAPPPGEGMRKARGAVLLALSVLAGGVLFVGLGIHFFGADVQWLGASPPRARVRDAGIDLAAGPSGTLSLNAWPSADVYLDDVRLAERTPIFNRSVPAGKHKIRFERPELGLKKELEVELEAGTSKTVSVKLDR